MDENEHALIEAQREQEEFAMQKTEDQRTEVVL